MEIQIKTVKLSTIKLNPNNPRRISNQDMDRLVKSLQEFPDMMKLREIIVDETMTILGGNMRLLALRKIGAKEATAKVVTGLTPEQKKEFIIKDNNLWGAWDFDTLANSWSDLPLVEWGIRELRAIDDPNKEWNDMPDIGDTSKGIKQILIHFETEDGIKEFSNLIGQQIGEKTKYIWYPQKARGEDES